MVSKLHKQNYYTNKLACQANMNFQTMAPNFSSAKYIIDTIGHRYMHDSNIEEKLIRIIL